MLRLAHEELSQAVQDGKERLENPPPETSRAVLVYDGFIHLEVGKIDAIVVETKSYLDPPFSFALAIPYRPVEHADGFAVHRPKFLEASDIREQALQQVGTAFFDGVDSHEKASEVWNAHWDPSI